MTDDAAYKLKKPIALKGLLDYSTSENRRRCAQDELSLNSEICPELYEGLVEAGKFAREAEGEVLLKMKRIPDGCVLSEKMSSLTKDCVFELARIIEGFHKNAKVDYAHGRLENIRQIWEDHKSAMAPFGYGHENIYEWANAFMENNTGLFARRVSSGRSRDCHGTFIQAMFFFTPESCGYLTG